MGKFESYPSINSLSDDDITLYNHNTETRKVTFLSLANCIKERVADPEPMPYSDNLVTSRGIYNSIQNAMSSKADKATTLAGYGIQDAYTMSDCDVRFMQEYDISSAYWDNEPTENSHKPVISGGIYDAIQNATTNMVGATANDDGARGLVPQPLAGDENKVLRGDGTWGDAASSVSDLTDVNLTNLSDKQLLRYNNTSSKWENISSDTTPTQNSTNPITSGGVYDAIQSFSTNFVGTLAEWNTLTPAEQAEYKTKDITDDYNGLPIDAIPTQNSANPVSSGGVYTSLAEKQPTYTSDSTQWDTTPTASSTKPVTSDGIKTALDEKTNETIIATRQTNLIAVRKYEIGEQFIYNNTLYKADAVINSNDTITIGGNASLADDITTQISNLAKNVDISTTRTDIFDSFNKSLDYFAFAVHGKVATLSFKTVSSTSLNANWNTLGTIKSQYAPCVDLSFCSYNNADSGSVQTSFNANGVFAVWVNGAKTNYPIHTSITYILKE